MLEIDFGAHMNDFVVSHSSEKYQQNQLSLAEIFVNKGTVSLWLNLDAGYDNIEVYRNAIERGAIKNGASSEYASNFMQAIGEGLENIARHNYGFRKGSMMNLHVRFNPFYDVASISGKGKAPDFKIIEYSMAEAISYKQRLEALNSGRLPHEQAMKEAMELLRGKSGKGVKDMLSRCDYIRCERHDEDTIWMLLMIRPNTGQSYPKYLN